MIGMQLLVMGGGLPTVTTLTLTTVTADTDWGSQSNLPPISFFLVSYLFHLCIYIFPCTCCWQIQKGVDYDDCYHRFNWLNMTGRGRGCDWLVLNRFPPSPPCPICLIWPVAPYAVPHPWHGTNPNHQHQIGIGQPSLPTLLHRLHQSSKYQVDVMGRPARCLEQPWNILKNIFSKETKCSPRSKQHRQLFTTHIIVPRLLNTEQPN